MLYVPLAVEKREQRADIVRFDTAVLPTAEAWAGVQPIISRLKPSGRCDMLRKFLAEAFFLPIVDPGRKAWSSDAMLATPQHLPASDFEGILV